MRRVILGMFALTVVAVPVAAQSVDEVTKQIAAASEKTKSFSAKTKMVTEMKQEGFSMKSVADGTTEMLRKGPNALVRADMKMVNETNAGGQVNKQEMTVQSITDESHTYTLSDMGGMKSAQKMKVQKMQVDPIAAWKETADLKLLPEATEDGRAVWVLEAMPKGGAASGQGKTILSFDKETGQMIKMVAHTPDGKPMTTMTYSDIKVNPDIKADRFVFKAPEGVEVQEIPGQ